MRVIAELVLFRVLLGGLIWLYDSTYEWRESVATRYWTREAKRGGRR